MNLHAIEQMQGLPRTVNGTGQVAGVGRPKLDFHTGEDACEMAPGASRDAVTVGRRRDLWYLI